MTKLVVGVAWYSRATWTELRRLLPDDDKLEQTYEEWLAMFEEAFAKVQSTGVQPERYEVKLDALLEWCSPMGAVPDSSTRAAFVSEQLRLRDAK